MKRGYATMGYAASNKRRRVNTVRRNRYSDYQASIYRGMSRPRRIDNGGNNVYGTVARTRGVYGQGEMKYSDQNIGALALSACTGAWPAGAMKDPGGTLNLCSPAVGAAITERIGREIKIHTIKIRGIFAVPAQVVQGTADNATVIRWLLVWDQQTNATQMTALQLMANDGINAFQSLENFGRFKVLKDKRVTIGNANLAGSPTTADLVQSGIRIQFKCNYRFKVPISVRFNAAAGGAITSIVDNSFHFIACANDIGIAPTVEYVSRVCYKE